MDALHAATDAEISQLWMKHMHEAMDATHEGCRGLKLGCGAESPRSLVAETPCRPTMSPGLHGDLPCRRDSMATYTIRRAWPMHNSHMHPTAPTCITPWSHSSYMHHSLVARIAWRPHCSSRLNRLNRSVFKTVHVNIFRDPRWGRGQETPGEDPVLAGTYAAFYVRGLQGGDGDRLKVAACCKHFTAYDLDNWNGVDRFHFNAKVSKQDIEDTFDVPIKMCVQDGNVASVMCSYNEVNGIPTCADPNLLRNTVRGQWKLDGYIVSDCDSVGSFTIPNITRRRRNKRRPMPSKQVWTWIVGRSWRNTVKMSPSSQELALEAARQGIVLLKNHGPSLPLSHLHHRTVAVIGPNSDATVSMIGNYADDMLFGAAIDAARRADATILVMGLDQSIEAEFRDRKGLHLPGRQQELVSQNTLHCLHFVARVPEQAGGVAIADVLCGTTNPGGKLPMTWYPQEYVTNLAMRSSSSPRRNYPGRTYRFYKGPVVYPFGHGLSYTNFVHTIVGAPNVVTIPLDGHRLQVNVKNTGSKDGTHTMLVFSTPPAGHGTPHKQTAGSLCKSACPGRVGTASRNQHPRVQVPKRRGHVGGPKNSNRNWKLKFGVVPREGNKAVDCLTRLAWSYSHGPEPPAAAESVVNMEADWKLKFRVVPREGNKAVDCLTRLAWSYSHGPEPPAAAESVVNMEAGLL
ncbi:putative beta-D-xylosidase 2 [Hibiscus syriacus]|uniref:Beta-D-xylosidase 2 n=1 Tax=Hibiscus syriacus TaxID=106335 RepID=A0A6A3C236_HIBSY|nr:putative beta-D-xylosidase 2 [Hibiscus syriacus]